MRRVSMATRDELLAVVAARYWSATRTEKTRIADEFVAVMGFHREHVLRRVRPVGARPHDRVVGSTTRLFGKR